MSNLTLKQFRYFVALARYGHFGRAADACAISQPALSMQIKEMEDSLGTVLLERGGRQFRLTAFGEVLAIRARAVLQAVEEIEDLARASHETLTGRLRIGVIPTIAPYLLPRLMGAFGRNYPGLDVQIRETQTKTLIDELAAGQIDTAILALPVSEPAMTEVALFNESFVLVRHESDAGKPVPDRAMLREMRLLLLEEGHCFRDQALSFCNVQSVRDWGGMDGSSLSTLVQMVGAGMGVTLLPEMAIAVESRAAPVATVRFPAPEPARTIGMIWRRSNPLAEQLSQVASIVKASGLDLIART